MKFPKLSSIDLKNIDDEIILFKQDMFYYKFNLTITKSLNGPELKLLRKRKLISPQWLRNVKDKKYPFYRIDTLISETKYMNVKIMNDGGWHFSNIKQPKLIRTQTKIISCITENLMKLQCHYEIENLVKRKQAIYDLSVDKRKQQIW